MKVQLKQSLLAAYPAWHDKPLSLTVSEIDNPRSVLDFFFTCYDLPDIRACLNELLHDALRAEGTDAASHVSTHKDLEKLVEAVWVIHQQKECKENAKGKDLVNRQNVETLKILEKKQLPNCYKSIHEFFSFVSLPIARKYLMSAIKAAESNVIWNRKAPTDLLSFFEDFEMLLDAVFTLGKRGEKIKQVLLPKSEGSFDPSQTHFYCVAVDSFQPWDYFSRSLTSKEYRDPYKAIQHFISFASKKEWKENLRYILSYALGENSVMEMSLNLELVQITEHLLKMLEACHLIYVRTPIQTQKI